MCEDEGITVSLDVLKAAGVFGGGIGGVERICGVAAAGAMAIGLKYSTGTAKESAELRERSAAFIKEFIEVYGSDLCKDLKPLHFKEGCRCVALVEDGCDMVKKHLN